MDWLEIIGTILAFLINMLTVLNTWILLNLFFGCDLRLSGRNIVSSAGIFIIFNVGVSFFFYFYGQRFAWLDVILILLFISLGAACLSKQKRWKAVLFSLPAVLLYILYTSSLEMLDVLLGLEAIGLSYDGEILSPLKTLADPLFFIILILILKKCERQKWSLTLTAGEGIGVAIFCILLYYLRLLMEEFAEAEQVPFYRIFIYIFLIALNIGFIYAIIHRKLAGYYRSVS